MRNTFLTLMYIYKNRHMEKRDIMIQRTLNTLNHLPDEKISQVSEYSEFLLARVSDQILTEDVQEYILTSGAYRFLKDDQDIYTLNDLKESYL